MSVRLVLDTSALIAYIAEDMRSLQVGELIASVDENEDQCGIPALCLLAACKQVEAASMAKLLELAEDEEGPTVVLPLLAGDVREVAAHSVLLPDDRAQAASETLKHGAMLGTYERSAYAKAIDDHDILDL
ncbi:MAG TPA: hypothetical protein VF062_10290 [Candidatus Limnocylindrales bacterium]